MTRRPLLLIVSFTLLMGILIGSTFESWVFTATVEANAQDENDRGKLYRELQSGTNALMEASRTLSIISRVMNPSVVRIKSEHRTSEGSTVEETGSGVIVTSKSASGVFVVTNRHVIDGADLEDIALFLFDSRVITPSQLWTDKATDIAVLKVNADGLQPARWGNSDEIEIGHMVLAMGSPFGLSHSITYGIISAKGRRSLRLGKGGAILNQDFLQTDAAINPGNSGGPLVDLHGSIIGINTAIASNSGGNEGIGFSIPSNLVRRVSDELISRGSVQRAYLGVKLDSDFNAQIARRLQLDRARGARILQVYDYTPAAKAQLQFDDVIHSFNKIPVQDENHLINLVSLTAIGSRVQLVVWRNGRKVAVEVMLTDRSEYDQRADALR